jgi:hypothetical protein
MPGVIYRILPKTTFTFSGLTGANQFMTYALTRNIDCSAYKEVTAIWRIHSYSISQTPSVKLEVWNELTTPEDPGMNPEYSAVTSTTITLSGLTVPYLTLAGATLGALGSLMRVKVTGQQGATAGTLVVTVSGDLVAKS